MEISVSRKQNDGFTIADLVASELAKQPKDCLATEIIIKNKSYDYYESNPILSQRVSEVGEVKIVFKTNVELTLEGLESCPAYIETIERKIKELSISLNNLESGEHHAHLSKSLELLDLFVQLVSTLTNNIKIILNNPEAEFPQISILESEMLRILTNILKSGERGDWSMLNDLLQYDLMDNLHEWKTKGILELSSHLNQFK